MKIPITYFEHAFQSTNPALTLRTLVANLAAEGNKKADIYDSLEQLLLCVRQKGEQQEGDEGVILDVMDALTDWCHPSARLLPEAPPLSDPKPR
jgi:hypothetical protein